jgi:hypothetical protein
MPVHSNHFLEGHYFKQPGFYPFIQPTHKALHFRKPSQAGCIPYCRIHHIKIPPGLLVSPIGEPQFTSMTERAVPCRMIHIRNVVSEIVARIYRIRNWNYVPSVNI